MKKERKMDKYKKKNPFTVPEGYFEGLNEQIISRLEKQEKPHKPGIVQIFKPYMVEKLESSSKEYSNTYEIIDQSE